MKRLMIAGLTKRILFGLLLALIGSSAWANTCPTYPYPLSNGMKWLRESEQGDKWSFCLTAGNELLPV